LPQQIRLPDQKPVIAGNENRTTSQISSQKYIPDPTTESRLPTSSQVFVIVLMNEENFLALVKKLPDLRVRTALFYGLCENFFSFKAIQERLWLDTDLTG
jgi:hypothetical protein